MGDAIQQSTSKVHAFFKQHKRKADFKCADVVPKGKINHADGTTPINTNNNNDTNAVPSTSSTMEGPPNVVVTPTPTELPTELGNDFDELELPETRLNAMSELMPEINDI